ncbi:hypothetical protein HNO88_004523 [Novosphingobium chloroacetimidivorans]|uniref:DUF1153 domain-containing protein n=1 Tax=Novosphingobium chloroacetimidivorans TaxID=1428314 RepID=A0A7W7NZ26_9SPHN|nr:DUF1153 domain-containing protein [Novosphingobium chloroacetimidivorans]MBB4861169.1 hypothetical protein [Novosphingobium chloroacetimidivorans]
MLNADNQIVRKVVGPLGEVLTFDKLPEPGTSRWVARRKAEVVAAVEGGLLSVPEACARYQLSLEELVSWQRAVERDGISGLRASKVQQNRQRHERHNRRQTA